MPELQAIEGKTYADVRKGDYLLGQQVDHVKHGTKYAHVTFATGSGSRTHSHPLTDYAPISRMVQTEAELQAQATAFAVRWLDTHAEQDRTMLARTRQRIADAMRDGYELSWSLLEDLPELEAKVRCWDEVDRVHLAHTLRSIENAAPGLRLQFAGISRLEAVRFVVESAMGTVLHEVAHGGQSSSAAATLLRQGQTSGQAAWLNDIRAWVLFS